MRAEVTEADKQREKVRQYLRQCYAQSLPDLDHSIPLAVPMAEDHVAIQRYYERKIMRHGSAGTYCLYQTRRGGNTGRQKMKWRGWI